jgi:hypothetical protein
LNLHAAVQRQTGVVRFVVRLLAVNLVLAGSAGQACRSFESVDNQARHSTQRQCSSVLAHQCSGANSLRRYPTGCIPFELLAEADVPDDFLLDRDDSAPQERDPLG